MNSLGRAIKLLEMMGRHSGGLTNSQISRYLHISTSSTSYLLSQLEGEGCVKRDEDTGRYQVGLRLVSLAHGALNATGFQEVAGPMMHRLAAATGLTATIAVLERGEVLIIDRVHPTDSLGADSLAVDSLKAQRRAPRGTGVMVGDREPILKSASGRVLAAFVAEAPAVETLAKGELDRVRIQGHVLSEADGSRSIAAPITSRNGTVTAALAVTGPRSSPRWTEACQIVNLVREAASKISKGIAQAEARRIPDFAERIPAGAAR